MLNVAMLTAPFGNPEDNWKLLMLYLIMFLIMYSPVYIMSALSLFKIAYRRGISNAWLAWVPLGMGWILGRISDQYQRRVLGSIKNRRWIILLLQVASVLLYILSLALFIIRIARDQEYADGILYALPYGPALLALVATVAAAVYGWISRYDLFRSCDPKRAVLFFVLALVVPIVLPSFGLIRQILQLAVSGKDLGMTEQETLKAAPMYRDPWD